MNEVYEFLKKCGTYYLATVDSDGQPRNRPFGTINLFEGKLYIQTGKSKDVSKQIHKNPKVEICCFDGASGVWLRVAGELYDDDRREARADDGNTEAFCFKEGTVTATFSSFTGAPKVVKF